MGGYLTKKTFKEILLASAFCIASTIALIAVFSVVKLIFGFDDSAVKIITQIIKFVCVVACGFIFICPDGGFIKGVFYGIIACLITALILGFIAKKSLFTAAIILDVALYALAGGLAGAIAANIKSKK